MNDNQKALVESLGLKVKKDLNGTERLVSEKGLVPNGVEITDTYYPALFTKVIAQEVVESVKGFALQNSIFSREEWLNGIKEWFTTGILTLNDYDKEVKIEDWNPADPSQYSIKFTIDFKKYSRLKLDRLRIISAFASPSTLESFVNQEIKRHMDTINLFIQNEKAKIVAEDTSSVLIDSVLYDEIIDTTANTIHDTLADIAVKVKSLMTASADHLAISDNTIIYSATEDDLSLVMTPEVYGRIVQEIQSQLYHPDALMGKLIKNADIVDFKKAGVNGQIASDFRIAIFDKRKLRFGVQVDNNYWTYKAPRSQEVQELHNWFGFAIIPNLYSAIYKVNTTSKAKSEKIGKLSITQKIRKLPKSVKK